MNGPGAIESGGQTGEVELLALRAVAPRRAARVGGWVEDASLTTAEPPALRGLVLSQRDKTHHRVPATFNRTRMAQTIAMPLCYFGKANATYASPLFVPILPPPQAMTRYCRPFTE